jgi:hypothetical protein
MNGKEYGFKVKILIGGDKTYDTQIQFPKWNNVQDGGPSYKLTLEWQLYSSLP